MDGLVKRHLEVVDSLEFLTAAQAALLQCVMEMTDVTDPVMAAAGYHRIIGARQYLNQLLTIGNKTKPVEKPIPTGQLNHRV